MMVVVGGELGPGSECGQCAVAHNIAPPGQVSQPSLMDGTPWGTTGATAMATPLRALDEDVDDDGGDGFSVGALLLAARPSPTAPAQETPEDMMITLRGYQQRALKYVRCVC